jgi:hypothetical protein
MPNPLFPKWGSKDVKSVGWGNSEDEWSGTSNPTFDWGKATQAFTGGVGMVTNAMGMGQQGFGFNTNLTPSQSDPYSAPTYTGGTLAFQIAGARPQGATFGEALNSTAQGAMAGSTFGPVGTAVGAAVGLGSSLIGGRARKRRQKRELEQAQRVLRSNQNQYNQAEVGYRNQMNQREDYLERTNMESGLYNYYKSQY